MKGIAGLMAMMAAVVLAMMVAGFSVPISQSLANEAGEPIGDIAAVSELNAYKREEVVDQSTEDIAEALEPYDRFDYDGERILFNNSVTNAAVLTDVLREKFEYPGVRFEEAEDGRIAFYRDEEDLEDYSLGDAHDFVVEEVPDEYGHFVNDDWGVDIVTSEEVSKEEGARALAEEYFGEDEYVITHVGDKESDIMTSYDTFMLPQEGTEAHDYCQENKIPHVAVEDGAEYAEILAELDGRR